ncbi:MAG: amino acid permease [Chlamydiales bacterium]|nr:amino acid permease [Chlamydiales bacterium]
MTSTTPRIVRTLSVFSLAMINVAAIGSVKNWPLIAEYGFSAIFFYLLAALVFFLPISLVSAELATGWPKLGGIYVWVKEAFGHRTGFLAIWLLWFENVIWYPTILSFVAATIAYIFNPLLAHSRIYTGAMILILYWIATLANLRGMRFSSWVSSFSVICGTFLPGLLIIGLGIAWFFSGKPLQIDFTPESLFPNMGSLQPWIIFTGVLLTLAGIEMSAIHARDVKNPQKDYPKAIMLTFLLIVGLTLLGVLSIASVIPHEKISLVAGSLQAFSIFVESSHLSFLTPYIAVCIAIGAMGAVSTWIIGPTRGLLAAAQSGDLPPLFRKVNSHGMPTTLLLCQGAIVSILSLLFILLPTVNSAYWILTVLVSLLYLIMYFLMFAAAIKLRYKRPEVERSYRVPGGNVGMWIVAGIGILSSVFSFTVGFFPPTSFTQEGSTACPSFYVTFLMVGVLLVCISPFIILSFRKPSWSHPEKS